MTRVYTNSHDMHVTESTWLIKALYPNRNVCAEWQTIDWTTQYSIYVDGERLISAGSASELFEKSRAVSTKNRIASAR